MPKERLGGIAETTLDKRRSGPPEGGPCVGSGLKRAWSLSNAGKVAHAETGKHPLGCQVRVYMDGHFLFSVARATCELAQQDADELKRAGMERGWTEEPPKTDE